MKLTLKTFVLFFLISCFNKSENRIIEPEVKVSKSGASNKIITDTLNYSFPMGIGNDKGSVKVVGIRTYEDEKLASSYFIISLTDFKNYSVFKKIDKSILIDSNEIVLLKDTFNSDYLNLAIIKDVEFNFVRSNTLYFNAILENPIAKKEIIGRFSLFYRTKKKGIISGWITDEINETLPNNH